MDGNSSDWEAYGLIRLMSSTTVVILAMVIKIYFDCSIPDRRNHKERIEGTTITRLDKSVIEE